MSEAKMMEKMEFPYILFKINGGLFCVNSRYVDAIMELPEYEALPEAPSFITGIFSCRDKMVTMFDLRSAMKRCTMEQEYNDFKKMLDERKQDHINWVNALEKSIENKTRFPLAVDPHKCALGKWYDSFECDSNEVRHYMSRLEEPHMKLHQAAVRVQECFHKEDDREREECLNRILEEIRKEYVPRIFEVLEGAKELFHNRVFHEMVLVLSGEKQLGIVVDEVVSVEKLIFGRSRENLDQWKHSPYVASIMRSENMEDLILEVDVHRMKQAVDSMGRLYGEKNE